MKDLHETQATEEYPKTDDEQIFSPIEDFERIVTGGAWKRESLKVKSEPKWLRYFSYLILGFVIVIPLIVWILNAW
ncbi:hypothetical protein [Geobacillus sp. YF-1]|uniref:hypothetical protein n=1 Tax=Geobacillus sp. YF-1 TaxID=3457480 RepID=UPI004045A4B2